MYKKSLYLFIFLAIFCFGTYLILTLYLYPRDQIGALFKIPFGILLDVLCLEGFSNLLKHDQPDSGAKSLSPRTMLSKAFHSLYMALLFLFLAFVIYLIVPFKR